MAARSGALEGISLISSIYSDDDDDMEDIEHQETPNDDVNTTTMENDTRNANSEERGVDFVEDDTPPLSSDRSRPLTPQQQQLSLSSPLLQQPVVSEPSRSRLHSLTIVDYSHDEVALSPEAELLLGDIQEKTPPGTAQVLSPSNKTNPQLSQQPDASESHTMNCAVNVSESTGIEEAVTVSMEASTDIDPFDRFLPPPPMARCSDELQDRINKFLYLKRLGKSYNAEVRTKKGYRNPDFLLHSVTYQDIDEIGSCFSKDVFDDRSPWI
ncbi:transcriptional regulator family protein [Actinidia rufa]|uniref:Transcriptional regulator family protein n=1 Tax=Actinidia rufa TaxID=165716 RepID=A0A7J0G8M1_9ERIC|nr:transcriptional regulator family protein [Actinidia rufa]